MNELKKVVGKAHKQAFSSDDAAAPCDHSVNLTLVGALGIPGSTTCIAYDSIQRLLVVRFPLGVSSLQTCALPHEAMSVACRMGTLICMF